MKKTEKSPALENEVLSNLANMEQIDSYYQKALQELEKSNEKFSRIFNYSNDAIFILDAEHKVIINANPMAHKMLAYPALRLKGMHLQQVLPPHARDFIEQSRKYMESNKGWTLQTEFQTQDLHIIPAEISASAINTDESTIIIAIVRDISLRVKWEEEREKLIRSLSEKNRLLESMVHMDSMTQLYNHQYVLELLEKEMIRARRYDLPLSIIMLDLDHFKVLNDKYGHQFGDEILIQTAHTITRTCREVDILGRYGGEEFLLVLPNTSLEEGVNLAERIRENISNLSWKHSEISLTISGGVTFWNGQSQTEFIKRADDCLYQAKERGRNQIVS